MKSSLTAITLLAIAGTVSSIAPALADCSADIDKVEYAIDHPHRTDVHASADSETKLRQLVEAAYKEQNAGKEDKCQDLINQAKYMGNIE